MLTGFKVEDKWDGKLPDGAFSNVSVFSVRSWAYYVQSWGYWTWVRVIAGTLPGKVRRVALPLLLLLLLRL